MHPVTAFDAYRVIIEQLTATIQQQPIEGHEQLMQTIDQRLLAHRNLAGTLHSVMMTYGGDHVLDSHTVTQFRALLGSD